MKISLVINCDSRTENNHFGGSNLMGVANSDMIIDALINKIKFFEGFETEVIVHLDKHNDLSTDELMKLQELTDVLLIRKHTDGNNFNDWNYLRALSLATGDIIVHVDQDTAMFTSSYFMTSIFLKQLWVYDFISYPSWWHPLPTHDDSFNHVWCSTRFFMCKREKLDLPEITKCLIDYDYWCATYPVNRKCHWVEHLIGSIAKYREQTIIYPPIELDKYAIFSWGSYTKGTLKELNNMSYEQVREWLNSHPIVYPNDVHA